MTGMTTTQRTIKYQTRERRVMTNNKLVLPLFIAFAMLVTVALSVTQANAQYYLTYQDRWSSGWNHALAQARDDWGSGDYSYVLNGGDPVCPEDHTDAYCSGYAYGYTTQWNIWTNNLPSYNNQPQQLLEQGQSCTINNSPGASCDLSQKATQGGN